MQFALAMTFYLCGQHGINNSIFAHFIDKNHTSFGKVSALLLRTNVKIFHKDITLNTLAASALFTS